MKKDPIQKSPGSPRAALPCVLLLGVACVSLAAVLLPRIGTPSLFMNFVRKPGSDALPLLFLNSGSGDVRLDVAGMEHFLFRPLGGGRRYILQLRSKPFGADEAENARRLRAMKTLAPGESVEIGDMRPVVAGMPAENATLIAVYSPPAGRIAGDGAAWPGGVKSLPMSVTE